MRGATSFPRSIGSSSLFQSTLPVRGATAKAPYDFIGVKFQSTLPVRGATGMDDMDDVKFMISIHAPRAGSDPDRPAQQHQDADFNPRSPCGERHAQFLKCLRNNLFQSTLPVRGATKKIIADYLETEFQSTLPVRGATWIWAVQVPGIHISIHAPRAGSDPWVSGVWYAVNEFQSTLPVRGATPPVIGTGGQAIFQSTLPVRGATSLPSSRPTAIEFQSTLPVRGATRRTDV